MLQIINWLAQCPNRRSQIFQETGNTQWNKPEDDDLPVPPPPVRMFRYDFEVMQSLVMYINVNFSISLSYMFAALIKMHFLRARNEWA